MDYNKFVKDMSTEDLSAVALAAMTEGCRRMLMAHFEDESSPTNTISRFVAQYHRRRFQTIETEMEPSSFMTPS